MRHDPNREWWPVGIPAKQERNRDVVKRHLADKATLAAIGAEFGLTTARVAVIIRVYRERVSSPEVHERNGRFGHVKRRPRRSDVRVVSRQLKHIRKKRGRLPHELTPPPQWPLEPWELW